MYKIIFEKINPIIKSIKRYAHLYFFFSKHQKRKVLTAKVITIRGMVIFMIRIPMPSAISFTVSVENIPEMIMNNTNKKYITIVDIIPLFNHFSIFLLIKHII
jgi:hypothetical protein